MFFSISTIIYLPDVKTLGALSLVLICLQHEPAAKRTVPLDPNLYCRIILKLFFTKCNIRNLNLHSKTDISKAASINLCLVVIDLSESAG